jgi:hypothetical protein
MIGGETGISPSRASGLGGVRLLARHQKFGTTNRFGLQFGLKLPHRSLRPELCDGRLASQLLDRGLQLGTGTTA